MAGSLKDAFTIPVFQTIERAIETAPSPVRIMEASLPHELSEPLVEQLVHAFYARVRADAALGPIFEARLAGRWDAHLGKMVDFWSSIALKCGRYVGQPHVAHQSLGLAPEHFERWLGLFEETVATVCTGPAAAFFIDRAHRIADSLQIGLNIGPKALQIPTTSPIPA